jgi:hypothetical protein
VQHAAGRPRVVSPNSFGVAHRHKLRSAGAAATERPRLLGKRADRVFAIRLALRRMAHVSLAARSELAGKAKDDSAEINLYNIPNPHAEGFLVKDNIL